MDERVEELLAVLRERGAVFAYMFGSRAAGNAREDSDVDLAAWFGRTDVAPWEIPGVDYETVDLIILDTCPLELAGRVATQGKLLFESDTAARVRWEATTRKVYFDEQARRDQMRRDFVEGAKQRAAEAEARSRGRS